MSFANKKNQHHHFTISLSIPNQYLDTLTKLPNFLFSIADKTRFFSLILNIVVPLCNLYLDTLHPGNAQFAPGILIH